MMLRNPMLEIGQTMVIAFTDLGRAGRSEGLNPHDKLGYRGVQLRVQGFLSPGWLYAKCPDEHPPTRT